jgi:hypothetical protein
MKLSRKIYISVVAVFFGLLIACSNDHASDQQAKMQEWDLYSSKCQNAYSSGGARVLDWMILSGTVNTSSGKKITGRADLGHSSIDVTCYFDHAANVLRIESRNSPKDPYKRLQELSGGNG